MPVFHSHDAFVPRPLIEFINHNRQPLGAPIPRGSGTVKERDAALLEPLEGGRIDA